MERIGSAIGLVQRGLMVEARLALAALWLEVGSEAPIGAGSEMTALHRCAIAHSMADAQPDPADELHWDLRALDAARAVTDLDVTATGMGGSAAALLPSLQLNVGESYRKVGNLAAANEHARQGWAVAVALGWTGPDSDSTIPDNDQPDDHPPDNDQPDDHQPDDHPPDGYQRMVVAGLANLRARLRGAD